MTEYIGVDDPYTNVITSVQVRHSDGSMIPLDPVLTQVMNYWSGILYDQGLADYPQRPVPDYSNNRVVPRHEAKQLALEALRMLGWQQTLEMRRFNVATGRPEGCDLTGADMQFRIFKPAYALDITIKHSKGDTVVSLDLSELEAAELSQLQTDADREGFFQKVFANHAEEFAAKANVLLEPIGGSVSIKQQ